MNNITIFKPKIILQGCLLALCFTGVNQQAYALNTTVSASAFVQTTVKGKVTSGTDKMPVPGVTVTIKGTSNAAITDIDGNYEIQVSNPGTVLVFSSLGFETQEITFGC